MDKLTCAKFFAFSNIPIYCYSGQNELLFLFPDYFSELKEAFVQDCISKMEAAEPERQKPSILTLDNKAHLAAIPLEQNLTIFVGPVSLNPDEPLFPPIYQAHSKHQLCTHMSYEKFTNAVSLLLQLCTGKINHAAEFISIDVPVINIHDTLNDSLPGSNIIISYPGEALEQRFITCIERGNVEGLMAQFELSSYVTIDNMSSDPVQHQKYLFIIFMTMAVRAAIKGGVADEKAFEIVGIYCLRMDKCSDVKTISSLTYNMALSLCREVYKHGIKSLMSPEIRNCCSFISSHLYSPLNLTTLAKAANMSTRNLSNRFRQEMGTTPMAYVQSSRIEEAKFLLCYTKYSLLEISNALHFSSQSYFTSIFHRVTGITPRQYRESRSS